ncbi:hypothetical protein D3C83_125100 [compost metagenome]
MQRGGLVDPADKLVGLAGHGGNDHRDLMAGVDLAFDMPGRLADAFDIGDRGAAELDDDAGQEKSPETRRVHPASG